MQLLLLLLLLLVMRFTSLVAAPSDDTYVVHKHSAAETAVPCAPCCYFAGALP